MIKKEKRVCLVTINDLENYGNRLQNFALQYFLKNEFGCCVRTLWPNDTFSFRNKISYFLRQFKWHLLSAINYGKYRQLKDFFRFNKLVKKDRSLLHVCTNTKKIGNKYDYFIVGSDQVFSEKHCVNLEQMYMPYVTKQKKICYAGSFGTNDISEKESNLFYKYSDSFLSISLREIPTKLKAKQEIIQIIDPVFLVSKSIWSSIGTRPKWIKNDVNFLFVYWLGIIPNDVEEKIKQLSNNGVTPIICNIYADSNQQVSINNFIWLIENSSMVLTNSFHGTALSIIFNKNLISVPKKGTIYDDNMDIRFKTLKEIFKLNDELFVINEKSIYETPNWDYVNKTIESQKKKAIDFFTNNGL